MYCWFNQFPEGHQIPLRKRSCLYPYRILSRHLISGCKSQSLRHKSPQPLYLSLLASVPLVIESLHFVDGSCFVSQITVTDEPDALNQTVSVLVKGHDRAVLDSYQFFATMAARELGIRIGNVYEPEKRIHRLSVLKSVHIFKKHRVQYEMRTHYRCIELEHVTGSTAKVYLEYIQRNLPEGVAMEVTKVCRLREWTMHFCLQGELQSEFKNFLNLPLLAHKDVKLAYLGCWVVSVPC
ncbi:hypothetical protein JZ751_009150 [Albula glossodonta]|uniref:Small ribosomal subunit protein uS10m n=1 Tax=Albula glossodonta TaxID=121402 RepID=A0A8T2N123_9TELE|nr:hypothetical protein JZ751_009150 [Albula glossodonta]